MKKKLLVCISVFVLLLIPAVRLQLKAGVQLEDRFFIRKNQDLYVHGADSVAIRRTMDGAEITVQIGGEELAAALVIKDEQYLFSFSDGRTARGYGGANDLLNTEGLPIWMQDGIVVTVGNEEPPNVLSRTGMLSNGLYQMTEGITTQRGHLLLLISALAMYALGTASILWPEEVHFWGGRWMYKNPELSDDGIIVQKCSGVVCTLIGIGLLYAPLIV